MWYSSCECVYDNIGIRWRTTITVCEFSTTTKWFLKMARTAEEYRFISINKTNPYVFSMWYLVGYVFIHPLCCWSFLFLCGRTIILSLCHCHCACGWYAKFKRHVHRVLLSLQNTKAEANSIPSFDIQMLKSFQLQTALPVWLPDQGTPRGAGVHPFLPFSSLVHSLPHLLLFYFSPFLFLVRFTYFCPPLPFL